MKVCKVEVSDIVLFDLIGLSYDHNVIGVEYEGDGVFALTITGTADDIPEVKDGEPIPLRQIRLTRQTARIASVNPMEE